MRDRIHRKRRMIGGQHQQSVMALKMVSKFIWLTDGKIISLNIILISGQTDESQYALRLFVQRKNGLMARRDNVVLADKA